MNSKIIVATAATALTIAAACSGDKTAQTPSVTPVEYDPSEAVCEPVAADLTRDTTFTCGDVSIDMQQVERITRLRDDQFLSLSLTVPKGPSALTTAFTALVDSSFYYYTDIRTTPHNVVATSAAMADAFAILSSEFADKVIPEVNSNGGNGGFNITISAAPVWAEDRCITYQIFTDAYTGGANDDTAYYYATYDIQSGMQMQFNQLVPPADATRVRREVVAQLAEHYDMNLTDYLTYVNNYLVIDPEDTSVAAITIDNFPIIEVARVAQGYVFSYPKGDIGPNSDGNIVVTVNDAPADNGAKH